MEMQPCTKPHRTLSGTLVGFMAFAATAKLIGDLDWAWWQVLVPIPYLVARSITKAALHYRRKAREERLTRYVFVGQDAKDRRDTHAC